MVAIHDVEVVEVASRGANDDQSVQPRNIAPMLPAVLRNCVGMTPGLHVEVEESS